MDDAIQKGQASSEKPDLFMHITGLRGKMIQDAPLFDELWDYNQPQKTAVKFHAHLSQIETSGDESARLQLLTQLARTQSLQQNFEEAHAILDKVEPLLAGYTTAQIRYFLERGRCFNSANEKEKAIPLFQEAYDLATSHDEQFYAIDAAHMLGIAMPQSEQLAWNLIALQMAESATNKRTRQWLGSMYNNIGWTYHDMGDYEKASSLFKKALKWHEEEAESYDPRNVHTAKWCIARTYRSLGYFEKALASQNSLLAEVDNANQPDGYVYEEISECLLALERADEARPYFNKAYIILSQDQWMATNEAERLARLKKLARGNQPEEA